jgi:outer membrane lipoprotein carrier protein
MWMKIQRTQILKYAIAIVFLCNSLILCAQPEGYQPVKSQTDVANYLNKYAAEVTSIQSDFNQEKHLEYLDVALQSGGKFWFKSPDKVSWVYNQPYNYTMILNSGKLRMISDKSNMEMDMKGNAVFEQVNSLMLSAVNGKVFGNNDYSVKSFENESFYLLMLKPNSPALSEIIKEIHLYFEKKRSVVTKIKLIESGSDFSIISFSNLKINETFDNKIFNP